MKNLTLLLMDSIAIAMTQAYMLTRSRLATHASPILRMTALRDSLYLDVQLLRRQVAVFHRQRSSISPGSRPHYGPTQRLEILQIMRLRSWSAVQTAQQFVLHPNTVRQWIKELHESGSKSRLFTTTAWNRIDDAVRWAARELRTLCPEPEIGARSIARMLVRAGVKISRSTIQRALKETDPKPVASKTPLIAPASDHGDKLLKPKSPNHVWHADLTTLRFLGHSFYIAALLDGFSRKIIKLRLYAKTPTAQRMVRFLDHARRTHGDPKHLITDHGTQFGRQFESAINDRAIHVVHGRVRCPAVNGKIERFFRTLRLWLTFTLLSINPRTTQRHLARFQHWYNAHRPHSALGVRTPDEAYTSTTPPPAIHYYAADQPNLSIKMERVACRDDPRLPIIHIRVEERRAAA